MKKKAKRTAKRKTKFPRHPALVSLRDRVIRDARLWWKKRKPGYSITGFHHIQPRAYVLGYAGSSCLIVSEPWTESEAQIKDWQKNYPLTIIIDFDSSLRPGDWCSTAYIVTELGSFKAAIPVVE